MIAIPEPVMRAGDAFRRHRLWVDRLMVVLVSLLLVLPAVALLMFDAWMREPDQPPLFGVPPVLEVIAGPMLWLVLPRCRAGETGGAREF